MKWIAIWGLAAVSACVLAGLLAGVKNRDHSSWMAWCFLVPPLVLVLLVLPRAKGVRPRRLSIDEEERRSYRQ